MFKFRKETDGVFIDTRRRRRQGGRGAARLAASPADNG
ncbi:putative phosphotransferase domain protein [Mycobacterium avium subsp. avium 2285 (R)]|nr:putative phosphotransferase domain protein [Mycobacterium avium subsp. avium 2285 (R)]